MGELLTSIGLLWTAWRDLVVAVLGAIADKAFELSTQLAVYLNEQLQPVFDFFAPALQLVSDAFLIFKDVVVEHAKLLYEGVYSWLVVRFQGVVDGVKGKIDQVTGFFRDMTDKVVGNSYVPDLVDGTAAQFAKLDDAMVKPTSDATKSVIDRFAELADAGQTAAEDIQTAWDDMMAAWKENTGSTFGFVVTAGADMASSVLGSLRDLGIKSKAIAVAQALLNAISHVAKTLAVNPWPMSIPAVIAASAAGAAQVAAIKSAAAFREGTLGIGGSLGFADFGSGMPSILHDEEAVVPRGKTGSLADEIADQMPGGDTASILARLDQVMASMEMLPTNIHRAVRDGVVLSIS